MSKFNKGDKILGRSYEDLGMFKRGVAHSDNSWFYCTNCGSGNTEIIED